MALVVMLAGCLTEPKGSSIPESRAGPGDLAGLGSDWRVRYEIDGRASFEMKAVGVQNVPILGDVVVVETTSQGLADFPDTVYFATIPLAFVTPGGAGETIDFLNAEQPFIWPYQVPFLAHLLTSEKSSWRYLLPPVLAEGSRYAMPPYDGVFAYPTRVAPDDPAQPWIRYEFDGRLLPARIEMHHLPIPHAPAPGGLSEWVRTEFEIGATAAQVISPDKWLQPLPGTSAVPFPELGSQLGTSLTAAMAVAADDYRVANFIDRGVWWVQTASYAGLADQPEDEWVISLASEAGTSIATVTVHGTTGSVASYEETSGNAGGPPFGLRVPNIGAVNIPGQSPCLAPNPSWLIGYQAYAQGPDATLSERTARVGAHFYSVVGCEEPAIQAASLGGRFGLVTQLVVG